MTSMAGENSGGAKATSESVGGHERGDGKLSASVTLVSGDAMPFCEIIVRKSCFCVIQAGFTCWRSPKPHKSTENGRSGIVTHSIRNTKVHGTHI
jgi:hypothetical protein